MVAGSDTALSTRITPALARVRRLWRSLLDRLGVAKTALLSRVPQRFHAITDEMAKFGTIGLINLGVNFAVFNALLVLVSGSQVKAKAVATLVATTCAYFLNRYWTYRHRPKTTLRREYSLFFLFNAVGLGFEIGVVALAKYGFAQTGFVVLNLATFVGIALGTVFRFWAYRTHVFKNAPAADPLVAGAQVAGAQVAGAQGAGEVAQTEVAQPEVVAGPAYATRAPRADAEEAVGGLLDEELRDELVQLELDELISRRPVTIERTDPAARH